MIFEPIGNSDEAGLVKVQIPAGRHLGPRISADRAGRVWVETEALRELLADVLQADL